VCVIGSGETAGSVTTALLGLLPAGSVIELVSEHGVLYTRGESFAENRFYSDPAAAGWQQLAERHRREFLKRTDRGVFSVQVQEVIDRAEAVRALAGHVSRLEPVETKVLVDVDYEQERERLAFDWVVVAVGFDPLWFTSLLGGRARAALAGAVGSESPGRLPSRTVLERAIGHDLAVSGLAPRLHLPVLAGVAQGPGFPNLSCLGLLADRVLGAYARRPRGAFAPTADAAATPSRAGSPPHRRERPPEGAASRA
jgi:mycobactin lysine-N-oxygenase